MARQGNNLKLAFDEACFNYVESFLIKHGLTNVKWTWIKKGALLQIGTEIYDYFDIMFDLDNRKDKELFTAYMTEKDADILTYDEWLKENML
jgi:hypothetical protein